MEFCERGVAKLCVYRGLGEDVLAVGLVNFSGQGVVVCGADCGGLMAVRFCAACVRR